MPLFVTVECIDDQCAVSAWQQAHNLPVMYGAVTAESLKLLDELIASLADRC